jgi:hypothetical protein
MLHTVSVVLDDTVTLWHLQRSAICHANVLLHAQLSCDTARCTLLQLTLVQCAVSYTASDAMCEITLLRLYATVG